MSSTNKLRGIHHVTAIAGDVARNVRFYRDVLGLRLVKRTVNFDDPTALHLYFGDAVGSPGTVLTFFYWPGMRPAVRGSGMIETIGFGVPTGSIGFWRDRLEGAGVPVTESPRVFGESGLCCEDPDGLRLEFIGTDTEGKPWNGGIPASHAIRGFVRVVARLRVGGPTDVFLRERVDFHLVREENGRRRYCTALPGMCSLDVVTDADVAPGQTGVGAVHHIAWTTPDEMANVLWRERLVAAGRQVSPLMDRTYFRSIYFREPGGILFEMATQGPGFAVDEDADSLGTALKLPSMHEARRAEIEEALPRLDL
jgi:glyoxalase family protein